MRPLNLQPKRLDSRSLAIHDRAIFCAKRFLIAEAELLGAIMEVDEHRIYEKFALPALTTYCAKILHLSDEVAGCFVRVARRCRNTPALKKALDEKRITLFKARAIAGVLTPENAEHWIERAQKLTKEKLEQEIAEAAGKNVVRLKLSMTREQLELLKRARDIVSTRLGREVSLEETIAILGEFWLNRNDPLKMADRNQSDLRNNRSQERLSTRKLRLPAGVKHAVNRRDRGRCQARLPDGATCGASRWVHFHHLVPKSEGGDDSAENITTLCSAHHRQWHRAN